jgi:hypothetical protein
MTGEKGDPVFPFWHRRKFNIFFGKMGAGKPMLSHKIYKELNAILVSEDDWLSTIYPEEILFVGS